MVEVIVPSRFDQLVNGDGTATTLFSAFLESITANNNDNIDIVEPYYRSLAALAALRAEVEDLKIIHSVSLIPVDDTLQKRIDDLQEELIGFVMGLINQKDLTGFLRNVVEDATPQLGGNLDTQSFTVDGRDVSVDGTKLDTIETGATADQTADDIRTLGFFDTTNDGTGSGFDADLLDGNHSTAFATSEQGTTADNALPKAGGTMTGIIDGNNTTDSTSTTTGSIHTDGGMGIVKNITVGGNGDINGTLTVRNDIEIIENNGIMNIYDDTTGVAFSSRTLGFYNISGGSTTNVKRIFHQSETQSADASNGLEDGRLINRIIFAGTLTEYMRVNSNQSVEFNHTITVSNTVATINSGSGTPESVVTAPIGSTFMRTDGGAGTSFYVKESGTGNTGWVAK